MFLTELKAIIPKALSLERMVIVALLGVPTVTPLEEFLEESGSKKWLDKTWLNFDYNTSHVT